MGVVVIKAGKKLKMSNVKEVDADSDYPVKAGQAVYFTMDFNLLTENFKDKLLSIYIDKLRSKGLELAFYEYHEEIRQAEVQMVFTGRTAEDNEEDNDRDYTDPDHWNDPNKYRNLSINAGIQQTAFGAGTVITISAISAVLVSGFLYLTSLKIEVGDVAENITRSINYGFMALSFYTSYKILDLILGGD